MGRPPPLTMTLPPRPQAEPDAERRAQAAEMALRIRGAVRGSSLFERTYWESCAAGGTPAAISSSEDTREVNRG